MAGVRTMKYFKMKKLDVLLLVFIVAISFVPVGAFAFLDGKGSDLKYLSIQINGKETQKIKLTGNTKIYEIPIEQEHGEINIVEVNNETVKMREANCPDQLCVYYKPISKDGETIICLPHKLVLQIKGGNSIEDEGDIISY